MNWYPTLITFIVNQSLNWQTKQVNIILLMIATFRLNTYYSILEIRQSPTSYIDPEVSLVWSNNNYCYSCSSPGKVKTRFLRGGDPLSKENDITMTDLYYYVTMSINYLINDIYPRKLLSCDSGFLGGPAFNQIGIWILGKRGNQRAWRKASWSRQ